MARAACSGAALLSPIPTWKPASGALLSSRASSGGRRGKLGDVGMARPEEILLAQMAELRPYLLRHRKVIVDNQGDAGPLSHGQNLLRQAANLLGRRLLGAQLNQVRPPRKAVARRFRRAPAQVSRIHKGVKLAFL
jgi:hypothetical protein